MQNISIPKTANKANVGQERKKSLDGLKGIAMLMVLFYHMDLPFARSGHIGVVIFFVLTGYFLTKSLIKEYDKNHFIDFNRRIFSRVIRIWPTMMCLIVLTALACLGFNHVLLTKMRPDILPASIFALNISNIVNQLSYFDNLGAPSPLKHLWYLGVDFQFILLWPYIFVLLARSKDSVNYTWIRRACFTLAVLSAAWMAYLYVPGEEVTRVYYGLDTRAHSLLLGSWIALAEYSGNTKQIHTKVGAQIINAFSGLVLLALVLVSIFVPPLSSFYYYGGYFLIGLLSAFVIITAQVGSSIISRVMSFNALALLGKRSLSVYLVHYPVILLLSAQNSTTNLLIRIAAIPLVLVLAEVLYRVFESTCENYLHSNQKLDLAHLLRSNKLLTGIGAVLCVAALAGIIFTPAENLVSQDAIEKEQQKVDVQAATKLDKEALSKSLEPKQNLEELPSGDISLVEDRSVSKNGIYSPVLIGDSVCSAIPAEFAQYFPDGLIDAKVGRSPAQMMEVLQTYVDSGVVGSCVVLHAFNNSGPSQEQLEHALELIGENRELYLVTIKVPNSSEGPINSTLLNFAEKHDNVHVIDWHSLAKDHKDWFWKDDIHIRPEAQDPLTKLIANDMAQGFARRGGYVLNAEQSQAYRQAQANIKAGEADRDAVLDGF